MTAPFSRAKRLLTLSLFFNLIAFPIFSSDSTAWKAGAAIYDVGEGDIAWDDISNISSSNNSYASVTFEASGGQ